MGHNSVLGVGRLGPVDRRDVLAIWSPFNNQKGRYLYVANFFAICLITLIQFEVEITIRMLDEVVVCV